jgi:hypothetical protein
MYRLFHEGEAASSIRNLKFPKGSESGEAQADYLSKLRRVLGKMGPDDQKLLLHMAQKVATLGPELDPAYQN